MILLKRFSIRKRIAVILGGVYLLSMVLAIVAGNFILQEDTVRESREKTDILLASMQASRSYLKEVLRPKLQELHGETFILEGMSSTYMSLGIAKRIKKRHPDYIYRVVSNNPLNLTNKSDSFEEGIVDHFKSGEKQWRGFVDRYGDGRQFYAMALPILSEDKCLKCHGDPKNTYDILRVKYGTQNGYNYGDSGSVVGGLFVYVPAAVAIDQANKKLLYFALGFSAIFLIAFLIVDRIIVSNVIRPVEEIVRCADEISRGNINKDFSVDTNDEMKALSTSFNRMKFSLMKAMQHIDSLKRRR